MDDHGRTRPGAMLASLGWTPSTLLVSRAVGDAVVLTADPQGRLWLPLAARRVLGLTAGSRALLTVSPGRVTVQSATVLDTLAAVHNA